MACIGFFLNYLLNNQFNIFIIISWFFEKNGLENFEMEKINNKISSIINTCNIFIYHKHINGYGINADIIETFVPTNIIIIQIPNLRLTYNVKTNEEYLRSLNLLDISINNSDFKDYNFIIDNIQDINFFNTCEHPTHYTLFLLAQSIKNLIFNKSIKIVYKSVSIKDYYDENNRLIFKNIPNYVILPGRDIITQEINEITGLKMDRDYFDYSDEKNNE
jgi:hypothetical protein